MLRLGSGHLEAKENGRPDNPKQQQLHAFAWDVRSCSNSKDLQDAKQIHARIAASEHHSDRYLNNLLIDMYSKCGSLKEARSVFDTLEWKNTFSWNIMLAAYARNGHIEDARSFFDKMPDRTRVSFNAMVSAYAKTGNLAEARSVFEKIDNKDVVSWTTMLTAYAENGHLQEAKRIFDKMPQRNVISWTAMITGYIENGKLDEARELFERMPVRNVSSWNNMVKGYALYGHFDEAREIFDKMPHKNAISWTTMVTAYAQDGRLSDARRFFEAMPEKNVVSWNAMITAYAQHEHLDEAKQMFDAMTKRDPVTWTAMLTAYAQHGRIKEARELFDTMPQKVIVSWNAMVAAYIQNEDLDEARRIFNMMPQRNISTWNAVISGYAKSGQGREAILLFCVMDQDGLHPNDITFLCVIDACADLQLECEGCVFHQEIVDSGMKPDMYLNNALLHMYGRCGRLSVAMGIFESMSEKDRWTWNVMVAAYARAGHTDQVFELFGLMLLDGMLPDHVTFVAVLGACSHACHVALGVQYFVSMRADFGLERLMDHDLYLVMIDVLGRSGWLKEAEDLITNMPFEPDSVAWGTLLGGYRNHGDVTGNAKAAAGSVVELDPADSAPYVLLHNLYKEKLHMSRTRIAQ